MEGMGKRYKHAVRDNPVLLLPMATFVTVSFQILHRVWTRM